MHGVEAGGGSRRRIRHMRPVVTSAGGCLAPSVDPSQTTCTTITSSFFKDVRKISVGDCALFKPQQDSPPFIGIIRSLGSDKEDLQLGVNWLYRPTDVKLLKGVAPEAAPNEVFYSFHRDETPAASLLHPCKVAFLPRGVELPSGISSFVCRRVYDTANKRLWWLTDQDYIDDRQEEVDQLLRKTQLEMHATVQQQGGRSPKPVTSPMSSSQLKHSPDSVQNSTTVFPSQTKGKKRERSDQASEPVKRERSSKADDGDSSLVRSEGMLKSEIAKITEKGGLVGSEGVERLVQLMQPDKSERKMDLTCRSLLAGVIAATDKVDCLNQFVQLRGLRVLDEWLQEAHKGKIGDSSSPRDQDGSVEDFLLVLLRALDRLPVNLNALQMCNIGKSVNHLRSHRNSEIQKKARSLVDTWKKRVEAEMNINDSKSGTSHSVSWPARTRNEVSQVGNRHPSGSSDAAIKNSVSQLSSTKSAPVKLVQGEAAKSPSTSASLGNVKLASSPVSASVSLRDGHLRTSVISGNSELPQSAARDEKSSGSSQSHTNSQCSSDHAKTLGPPVKEDARRSALSPTSTTENCKDGQFKVTANGGSSEPLTMAREEKSSSSSQSHTNSQCSSDQAKNMVLCGKEDTRRSTAGSRSLNKSGGSSSKHRKAANCPTSGVHRETASNRSSCMARNSVAEKVSHNAVDASVPESNNHKLIVKIPNRGRGPAQSSTGGCLEDSSCRNSRASSPALSEKHDQSDTSMRGTKHDSHQLHEVDGSSTSVQQRTSERRLSNVSKIPSSPPGNEIKSRKAHDSSFSPMNALIESCAKISEANVSISAGDDVGMNLLASVAAREMSKSGTVSPAVSPPRHSKMVETSSSNHVGNQKQLHGDDGVQQGQSTDVADADNHIIVAGVSNVEEESSKPSVTKTENLHQNGDDCLKNNGTLDNKAGTASTRVSMACTTGETVGNISVVTINGKITAAKEESKIELPVASQEFGNTLVAEDKVDVAALNDGSERKAHRDSGLCPSNAVDDKSNVSQGLQSNVPLEQNSLAVASQSDLMKTNEKPVMVSSSPGTSQHVAAVVSNEVKSEKTEGVALCDLGGQLGNKVLSKEKDPSSVSEKQGEPGVSCADVDQDRIRKDQTSENREVPTQQSCSSATQVKCSSVALPERELYSTAEGISSAAVEEENKENSGSATKNVALSSASGGLDMDSKLGFDLNEGFSVDEGKNGEPLNMAAGPCPDNFCSVNPLQIPVSSPSCGLPASVTVAAAAKGPFVPPDDLLWNKRELGWKGSAATSAFRPAEPRKTVEVNLGPCKAPLPEAPACRSGRFPLDIDLNVADESSGQDFNVSNNPVGELMNTASLRSSGGLDLDLNKVDEAPDMAHVGRHAFSNIQRVEALAQHVNPSTSTVFSHGGASGKRDFDLNDGPATEEFPIEHISSNQHNRSNIPFQPSLGPRFNSSDTGNCFSWYPPGTSYPASVTPSALPDREAFSIVGIGGPQRVVGGPTSALSFNPDAYRGSVLSSSPALPFHPVPFQYPVLPFGTSFPLPTSALAGGSSGFMDPTGGARVSAIPSQLVGNAAAVSFQYPHAYVVSRAIPDVGNNGVIESNHKWGKQGLDLNSGPGTLDVEGRDDSLPIVSRQVSGISSQSLADEQARMYSMGGGHQKRKEPEGGWNIDKLNFKQSSWR